MLGFADVQDDDLLPARDVARRLGFAHWRSVQRWLRAENVEYPLAWRRGWYRGAVLKAWFRAIEERNSRPEIGPIACTARTESMAAAQGDGARDALALAAARHAARGRLYLVTRQDTNGNQIEKEARR